MELTQEFIDKMPSYQCHKVVQALKIKSMVKRTGVSQGVPTSLRYELVFEREGIPTLEVSEQWVRRSHCRAGGYFIRYDNGYTSFSPTEAFEDGYTRISSKEDPLTVEELNKATACLKTHELKYPKTPTHN